jgi:hypothetical protein
MARKSWVEVDLDGLRNKLRRRGIRFALYEPIQNALDENITRVDVTLPRPERGYTTLTVADDSPSGFRDLADAYTMFKTSYKQTDATKRGVFNLGEKLVLALCDEASIETTTGSVRFDADGRHVGRKKTEKGSVFSGRIRLTIAEWEELCEAVMLLVPTAPLFFNGQEIPCRKPIHEFEAVLPTMLANEDGELRRTQRKTSVRIYDPLPGETAMLYEMGIPVVETGDRWHVDVQQKVPLNMERDDVTPAYKRDLRVAVLNEMAKKLDAEEAAKPWVQDAISDERVDGDAVHTVIDLQFGDKHVTRDPSDLEANNRAVAQGYSVIPSTAFSRAAWENIRKHEASVPAGQVTPTPKAFHPNGAPLVIIPRQNYSESMLRFEQYARWMSHRLLKREHLDFKFAGSPGWEPLACYGRGRLIVNRSKLGAAYFEGELGDRIERWSDLLIHEFAHEYESCHLSEDYYDACTRLGGKLARLMLEEPYVDALSQMSRGMSHETDIAEASN